MSFNFDDLFPKANSGMKISDYANKLKVERNTSNSKKFKNEVFKKNMKGQAGLPIPASQLPFYRPHYYEGDLIEGVDYPAGANVDPNQFNSRLKPYMMNGGNNGNPQPYTTMNYQTPEMTQGPINTELALQGRQQEPGPQKKGFGFNGAAVSQGILGALGAVSSVLPDRTKKFQPIQPKTTYNPFASGTGSQAIMEGGGIIPTDKDGFQPFFTGGDPIVGNIKPSSDRGKNKANVAEMLSYFAAKGVNPHGTKGGAELRTQSLTAFDEPIANDLYNSMIAFSSRPGIQSMSPEQRINTFYELTAKNKKLEPTIAELRNINYGPIAGLNHSPYIGLSELTDEYIQPVKEPSPSQVVKKKTGGSIRKKDNPELNAGGDPIKDFFRQYIKSPNYKERLEKQGYLDPDKTIANRLKSLNTVKETNIPNLGNQYFPKNHSINFDINEMKEFKLGKELTRAHEMSHAIGAIGVFPEYLTPGALNETEINLLNSKNKQYTRNALELSHDGRAQELKADIDVLRYMLKRDKIYDTGTQEFTPKILNKVKSKYKKDNNISRIFDRVSDKDLIYLMNNIAKNNNSNSNLV